VVVLDGQSRVDQETREERRQVLPCALCGLSERWMWLERREERGEVAWRRMLETPPREERREESAAAYAGIAVDALEGERVVGRVASRTAT